MGKYTEYEGKPEATGMRLAIVAGRFNDDITKLASLISVGVPVEITP